MVKHPLNETIWKRGWKDTAPIWASWPFVILDAVVCVMVGAVFTWYWGLLLFAFALFCVWLGATASAPIRQRNEARKCVDKLERERKPRLTILGVKVENNDFTGAGSELSMGLQIKNLGTEQAKDCQGRLVNVCFAGERNSTYTLDTQPTDRFLAWTQEDMNNPTGCIPIDGGSTAILQVATCRLSSGLSISYAGDRTFREKMVIKLPYGVLATLSITSKGATPIYTVCYLKKEIFFYSIELVDTLNALPDINHYRSLIDNRGGYQI